MAYAPAISHRNCYESHPMKLFYAPGACSLADHIALNEAALTFDLEKVDVRAKKTESGEDFLRINPKGYVPALELDNGEIITENLAILDWISHKGGLHTPPGPLGHTTLLQALAFITTEIHKGFKAFFDPSSDQAAKDKAGQLLGKRFRYLADGLQDHYLFGSEASVADAYLFVMLTWAKKMGVAYPEKLEAFFHRMLARPAVAKALASEGLDY